MPLKVYILNMVGSKQLNNKLKIAPKISLRTRQAEAATPTTSKAEENNEDLIETLRKIVRKELEGHREISEIIKSQLTNTSERLDKISQEVIDRTKNLEFTHGELHDGLASVKNNIKKVQTDLTEKEDYLLDPTFVIEKLTELGDRSQRNNVPIDGIPETSNERWESCKGEVKKTTKNKLDITGDIEIARCQGRGKFPRNKSKPRTVVFKFLSFKEKHKVFKLQES